MGRAPAVIELTEEEERDLRLVLRMRSAPQEQAMRARVRLRHSLVDDRGEWQQRMQAVLYHHGVPKRADLLTCENRAWVSPPPLPATGREQIAVARGDRRDRPAAGAV